MKLEDWPEDLPAASPPPGATGDAVLGRLAAAAGAERDPGHLMTDEEWARVQADAAALEQLDEGDDDAG